MLYVVAVSFAAPAIFWCSAVTAARRRGVQMGWPLAWLSLCAVADVAVTRLSGAPYSTTIALAGVAIAGLVDVRTGLIFDPLVVTILATTATASVLEGTPTPGFEGAICAVVALGAVWVATLGLGIGLGDVKLGSVVGIGLGCSGALIALALAFILGAVYGLALISLRRADRRSAVPFAPFIAGGTFIAVSLPPGGIR